MFSSEDQLVETFAAHVADFLESRGVGRHRYEVDLGGRVADIVATRFPNPSPPGQLLRKLRQIPAVELFYVAHLLSRPLKTTTLAERTWSSVERVAEVVHRMERRNILSRTKSGKAFTVKGWKEFLPVETVAFEAKLDDWREAIEQATTYARRADRAWVVMPERHRQNEDLRSACKKRGIGLVVVSRDSIAKVVRPRSRQGQITSLREMRLRLLWDLARNEDERWVEHC